jgi:N6-adenosine-specific RNA methylase IME4
MTDILNGLPDASFAAILADPPWRFRTWNKATAVRRTRRPKGFVELHYYTMTIEEIAAQPVGRHATSDSVLFLWVPWPLLQDGLRVMAGWGFRYKTCAFAWMKKNRNGEPFTGMGYWTRSNTEVCLLGTRGKPRRRGRDVKQAIFEPRREHSRKPDCVHERIERLVAGPYLELWARASTRPGWTFRGDEVEKFNERL